MLVDTVLQVIASKQLDKEIEKELKKKDPDAQQAKAILDDNRTNRNDKKDIEGSS